MDDETLVRRIQSGERELFEDLIARFVAPLFDLFRRRHASDADAEDLVQETLLQCLASIGAFRGKSTFRTWLFRMALNRMADRERRPRTSRLPDDAEEEIVAPPPREGTHDERVRAAIDRLPPSRREVVRLVHGEEDLDCAEAAARLGRSVEAVRKELSRAYRELRDLLRAVEEKHAEA